MGIKFANGGYATLASSITSSDTSITLTTGQGARFPSLSGGDYFYATLIDTSNNLEIVKCTARSTDVLTVTRAQESTTARAYSAGDRIELRITAQSMVDAGAASLDGDRGDITVSSSGTVWTIDNLAVTDAKINSMAATKLTGTIDRERLPAGSILQVAQATTNGTDTYSGSSYNNISLSATITPQIASSKFLLMANLHAGYGNHDTVIVWNFSDSQVGATTPIAPVNTNATSNRTQGFAGFGSFAADSYPDDWYVHNANPTYLYTPASQNTSQRIFRVIWRNNAHSGGGTTMYLNKSAQSSDDGRNVYFISTLTVLEIAA